MWKVVEGVVEEGLRVHGAATCADDDFRDQVQLNSRRQTAVAAQLAALPECSNAIFTTHPHTYR